MSEVDEYERKKAKEHADQYNDEELCEEDFQNREQDILFDFRAGFTAAKALYLSFGREELYLKEVTYWLGEHRAYVETGMMWESELAMKNSRRYGELAKREREKVERLLKEAGE